MTPDECFRTLGIAPTTDAATVKLAYFAALRTHAPHVDPAGFRVLRAAYEQLARPGALMAAFVASSVDLATELQAYGARFDRALEVVEAMEHEARTARALVAQFEAAVAPLTFSAAMARFGSRP